MPSCLRRGRFLLLLLHAENKFAAVTSAKCVSEKKREGLLQPRAFILGAMTGEARSDFKGRRQRRERSKAAHGRAFQPGSRHIQQKGIGNDRCQRGTDRGRDSA